MRQNIPVTSILLVTILGPATLKVIYALVSICLKPLRLDGTILTKGELIFRINRLVVLVDMGLVCAPWLVVDTWHISRRVESGLQARVSVLVGMEVVHDWQMNVMIASVEWKAKRG